MSVPDGTRIRIRKGALVRFDTVPSGRGMVEHVARRTYTATTVGRSYYEGSRGCGHERVSWAGAGGYWRSARLDDVEVVS